MKVEDRLHRLQTSYLHKLTQANDLLDGLRFSKTTNIKNIFAFLYPMEHEELNDLAFEIKNNLKGK